MRVGCAGEENNRVKIVPFRSSSELAYLLEIIAICYERYLSEKIEVSFLEVTFVTWKTLPLPV
jgi:hypothetical protein